MAARSLERRQPTSSRHHGPMSRTVDRATPGITVGSDTTRFAADAQQRSGLFTVSDVLAYQRTIGNRAVQRLLTGSVASPRGAQSGQPAMIQRETSDDEDSDDEDEEFFDTSDDMEMSAYKEQWHNPELLPAYEDEDTDDEQDDDEEYFDASEGEGDIRPDVLISGRVLWHRKQDTAEQQGRDDRKQELPVIDKELAKREKAKTADKKLAKQQKAETAARTALRNEFTLALRAMIKQNPDWQAVWDELSEKDRDLFCEDVWTACNGDEQAGNLANPAPPPRKRSRKPLPPRAQRQRAIVKKLEDKAKDTLRPMAAARNARIEAADAAMEKARAAKLAQPPVVSQLSTAEEAIKRQSISNNLSQTLGQDWQDLKPKHQKMLVQDVFDGWFPHRDDSDQGRGAENKAMTTAVEDGKRMASLDRAEAQALANQTNLQQDQQHMKQAIRQLTTDQRIVTMLDAAVDALSLTSTKRTAFGTYKKATIDAACLVWHRLPRARIPDPAHPNAQVRLANTLQIVNSIHVPGGTGQPFTWKDRGNHWELTRNLMAMIGSAQANLHVSPQLTQNRQTRLPRKPDSNPPPNPKQQDFV